MLYSYNGLWKMLIDHNMTKTEMRKQTGISTNILAKMGKGEPVAMESLAKICVTLQCSLDDIVEVSEEQTPTFSDVMKYGISDATVRNWEKLNTKSTERLTTRANKRKSKKRVLPLEYICNKENITFIQTILDYIDENSLDIMSAMFSLGIYLLKRAGIYEKQHVATVLSEYSDVAIIDYLTTAVLPNDEFDILGLIYQSYLHEGKKNIIGSYYTPQKIVHNMTKDFNFSEGKLFFDPCCGSGAFLLSVNAKNPYQIFGVDNDKVAVLISKINLMLKYRDFDFIPQVYCFDFLMGYSVIQQHPVFEKKFDYIATNPPWGAMDNNYSFKYAKSSKETFSYFFVKSYEQLKDNGTIRFLFPEAILNVKVHKDIRKFILDIAGLVSITTYDDMFSGVTTKYIDIKCGKDANKEKFTVYADNDKRTVDIRTVYETENLIFNLLSDDDMSIVRIVKNRGQYSLQNSVWALGVVTGDNKGKLSPECLAGMEKIYTGKDIQPFILRPAQNYILYDRSSLQQVAKEEIYRAPEKLVYKFISNKLVFAYDNSSSLFLNSANILIPAIPSMNVKAVMAFLNSSLFQFMYIKLFGEVKILKGNLIELPFPEISEAENKRLTTLVDEVLNGNKSKQEVIENYIFSIYGLTNDQISYVRRTVNGKVG
ncbi:MAG: N-6 DNA methylase [Lachnospiraceae bacterium]|nr:N-6 DNA methylase [Lachnospiraceae bacterium]